MIASSSSIGVVAAMTQSVIFIGYDLAAKKMREQGVDSLALIYSLRLSLFPALLVLLLAWDREAAVALLHNHTALLALFGFVASWLTFQLIYFRCLHVSHSLAVASVARNAVGLPLLMVAGALVNGDHPTVWGILAIALLMAASFLRPGRSKLDPSQYIESARTVLGLSIAFVVIVTVKDPLYRLYLQNSHALILSLAIYMVMCAGALQVYFWFRPLHAHPSRATAGPALTVPPLLMWAVPIIWVVGTIPEGIAFGNLPVYSMIAVGTVSWVITIATDIYFKRLAPTMRTAAFASLVVGSITLSFIDRNVF
jgi:hypothetical protein